MSEYIQKFKGFMEEWKEMSPEKKAMYRDEINTQAVFSRCEEVTEDMFEDADRLDRGDFIITRIIWDGDKEKYHDHYAIVDERFILTIEYIITKS